MEQIQNQNQEIKKNNNEELNQREKILNQQLKDVQIQNEQYKKEISNLNQNIKQKNEEISNLSYQLLTVQDQLSNVKKEYEAQNQLTKEIELKYNNQIIALQQQVDILSLRSGDGERRHQQENQNYQRELIQLKAHVAEDERRRLEEKQHWEQDRILLEKKYQDTIQSEHEQWQQRLQQMQQINDNQNKQLNNNEQEQREHEWSIRLADAYKNADEQIRRIRQQCQSQQEEAIRKAVELSIELENKKNQQKLLQLENKSQSEILKSKKEIELTKKELVEIRIKNEQLQNNIKDFEREKQSLSDKIVNQQQRIDQLSNESKQLSYSNKQGIDGNEQIIAQLRQQLIQQEQQLRKELDERLEEERKKSTAHASELRSAFEKAQRLMRRQLEQIEHELSDTVERFESREPRPQDLSTIASLETAVAEKDRLLMRLQEENKFYKLELHNREDNYNKKFQRQTTVGSVLNQTSQFGFNVTSSSSSLINNNNNLNQSVSNPNMHINQSNNIYPLNISYSNNQISNQTLPYLPMRSPSPSTNTESRNRSSINSSYSSPSLSSSISKSNSHTQLQSQSHIHTHTHSNTPPMSPNRDQISRDGSRERINKEKSGDKEKIISINSNKRVGSAIALRSSHNQLSQSISLASNSANGNRLPQIISKGKK